MQRLFFHHLKIAAALLWLVFGLCLGTLSYGHNAEANGKTELTGKHLQQISQLFLQNHFLHEKGITPQLDKTLFHYLNILDPERLYFLQADIKAFQANQSNLMTDLTQGKVELPQQIYQRLLQRIKKAELLLKSILSSRIKLPTNEPIELDRSDAAYSTSEAAQNKLWKQQIGFQYLQLTLQKHTDKQAKERIRKKYRTIHLRYQQFTKTDVLKTFLNAMLSLYDPHSGYLAEDDLQNFYIAMRLSLEGIGATLRWEEGRTIVVSIVPGGAAHSEGSLKASDVIVAVGQGKEGALQPVDTMPLGEVVKLIRGPRGTYVRLDYLREQANALPEHHQVVIKRDKIVLKDGEASGKVLDFVHPPSKQALKIGVIELPSFYVDFEGRKKNPARYKSAFQDVRKLLQDFKKQRVNGIILDLRGNGGGGLDEAVSVTGLFLPKGAVVQVKSTDNNIYQHRNPLSRPVYNGALVVLLDRRSASASEILAGALKDYGRAVLVGEKSTFGKGTVQNIIPLPNQLGALKTTVQQFYRPNSQSTQLRGVESHIVLPSLGNHIKMGEESLKNALPWDTIRPIRYPRFSASYSVAELLPQLKVNSDIRVDKNAYFQTVKRAVKRYVTQQKNRKTITPAELKTEQKANKKASKANQSAEQSNEKDPVLTEALAIVADLIALISTPKQRASTN